jgi:SAM-dependent methyltransferase
MNQRSAWYQDESFWRTIYPYMFDAKRQARTPKEVDGIIKLLNLQTSDAVLDLGCGDGRHLIELALRGYRNITGLDSTKYYLDIAKERAAAESLSIQFIQDDMRSPRGEGAYEVVLSLFSSLGYFEKPEDNLHVLQNAYRSLKPGGKLLIDVRGKENFAYHFDEEGWAESDGTYILTKRIPLNDFSVIENHWTIIESGNTKELLFSHWIYSAQELKTMCVTAGFSDITAYGGLDGSPYSYQSPRLIVVGRK